MANYSGDKVQNCNPDNNTVLERHNFAQVLPNTTILSGVTGLTFRNCNLVNCKVPDDAIVEGCNTAQIDRCSHLHSNLPYDCVTECNHMTGKEDIIVDGVIVDTIYKYEDIVGGV